MKVVSFFIYFLLLLSFSACSQQELKDGDILFQSSTSSQSKAVEIATNSPYSHCGILFYENGQAYVYEAVQPVGKRKLEDWIASGVDGNETKSQHTNSKSSCTSTDSPICFTEPIPRDDIPNGIPADMIS